MPNSFFLGSHQHMFAHLKNKVVLSTESTPLDDVRDNAALINCNCDLSPIFENIKIVTVSTLLIFVFKQIESVIYFKFISFKGVTYHRSASNNELNRDDGSFGAIKM